MLEAFARALPRALHGAEAPVGSRVRLVVSGEAGGAWEAERAEDGWRLGRPEGDAAAAMVTQRPRW